MQIEKGFRPRAAVHLGDTHPLSEKVVVPTGALSLDIALGLGGVPRGRVVEIYGRSPAVKLRFPFIWRQRCRKEAVSRHSLTRSMRWIPNMPPGSAMDIDELYISQRGEQALEIA